VWVLRVEGVYIHQVLGCADRRARYDLELTSSVFAGFAAAGEDRRRRREAGGEQRPDRDQGDTGESQREKEQEEPMGKEESARQQRMSDLPEWTTSHEVRQPHPLRFRYCNGPLRPRPGASTRHPSAVLDSAKLHPAARPPLRCGYP
jgi:hypothetical protein